jgi:kinesin family protein 5
MTCLVTTCSMSAYNDRETLSTMRFGNRAKSIKNKPIANVERSAKELMALLEKSDGQVKNMSDTIKYMQG